MNSFSELVEELFHWLFFVPLMIVMTIAFWYILVRYLTGGLQ